MTPHHDLHERAIERRLRARAAVVPSPGHRSRMLAAVRGALDARPVAEVAPGDRLGSGGVLALSGMAVAVAPLVIGPWLMGLAAVAGGTALPRPTLVEQARLVGVELPPEALAAIVDPAGGMGPPAGPVVGEHRADPEAADRSAASPGRAARQWLWMRHALVREL